MNRTKAFLDTVIGKKNIEFSQYEKKFFNILTDKNGTVISYTEKEDITQQSEECFGFFSLVTSSKMTFDEAIHLYKSRDNFEKLFMADKTFLGGRAYKVQSVESSENKSFIEFLALIVRNRMFTILQEGKKQSKTNDNFYLVPKAIKELDKIMLCENLNGDYRMNKNITAPCQKLISLFGLSIKSLREKALKVSDKLKVTRDSISLEARLEREETTQEEMYENTMYID